MVPTASARQQAVAQMHACKACAGSIEHKHQRQEQLHTHHGGARLTVRTLRLVERRLGQQAFALELQFPVLLT